jgi:hypothetical protein
MKKVKLVARAPQIPRVIEVAIQQTVGVEPRSAETPSSLGGPPAREAAREGWTNQHWLDRVSVCRTEMIEERVGHQIHARPSLFGKIRHHRHAQLRIEQLVSNLE